jgi:hypothetical protein
MTRLTAPFRRIAARVQATIPDSFRREDGTATMEFVLVIPIIMSIFMASFETGLLMTRSILLEQSVDMTMRELRLGHYPDVTNALLKTEICKRTIIFESCEASIKIQMDRVSTTAWDVPIEPSQCINRSANAVPVNDPDPTMGDNDVMIVRVCVILDAMFPSMGVALNLDLDSGGGYGLVARSAFVAEPTS